jgi:DNA-binding IclR family transcriptional regulator
MSQKEYTRDPERERAERECFIALQHAYNLAAGGGETLPREQLETDLGLPRDRAAEMVRLLSSCGYVEVVPSGREMRLTTQGRHYVECGAWRRRSVRLPDAATSARPAAPR